MPSSCNMSSRTLAESGDEVEGEQDPPSLAHTMLGRARVWGVCGVAILGSSGQPSPGADISLIGGVTVVVASKRLGVLLLVDPPWWCLNGTHLPPQCAGIRLIRPSRRHVCRAFWLVSVPQRTAPRIKKVLVVDVYSEFCYTVRSARLQRPT